MSSHPSMMAPGGRLPPGPMQPNGGPPQYRPPPAGAAPPPPPPPPSAQPPQHRSAPTSLVDRLQQTNEAVWVQVGRLAETIGNTEIALFAYGRAIHFNQYSMEALQSIASVYRSEDKYGEAVEYIKTILQMDPHNGESWSSLGHCYLMMDELQEAYQAYQSALYNLRDPKEPKLWYGIGILYDRYGSLDHAEEAFSQVMRMAPEFDKANEIYFRLGIIYKQQGKFDQSLECFRWIADKPPQPLSKTDIWFQIGHVYEQQKDFHSAKSAYRRVLETDPHHAKVLQQLGWLYHQESNDYLSQEQAIEYLEKSVNSDQTDAQSWYLLGRCYMSQQKFPKAYEAYQQAVYRDGRNPTFWCSIGVLYYQINQYRDALDAYSRAIRLNPNISEVWYDLGTLYESCNNQTSDALDAYQRAAELDPNNTHIKSRLAFLRSGQAGSGGGQNGQPAPQDIHPQAYQPSGLHGPTQPQWNAAASGNASGPAPGPPPGLTHPPGQGGPLPPALGASRDWNARPPPDIHTPHPPHAQPPGPPTSNPYDSRDTPRGGFAAPPIHRQGSPRREPIPPSENSRHTPLQRRVPSPSPRMRNALPPAYGPQGGTPGGGPPTQLPSVNAPSQPPPNRISNPNYGQPHPPTASQLSGPPHAVGGAPPFARSPPPEVKPIIEARPRSPRGPGFSGPPPQGTPYQHHANLSAPSNIASGAPIPMSAMQAAEAAAREREGPGAMKRMREWEERDDLQNKKPANDEHRARLEDPAFSRRGPTPPAQAYADRERGQREGSRLSYGPPPGTGPSNPSSPDAIRRADDNKRPGPEEPYRPSQLAHQPQPLNTTIHQTQQPASEKPSAPASDARHDEPAQAAPAASLGAIAAPASAPAPPGNSEAFQHNKTAEQSQPSAPPAEKNDADSDIRARREEPASRKMDIDEDYDDDSTEDVKNSVKGSKPGSAHGSGSVRTSPRTGAASVSGSNNHNGVSNGQQAKVEA